jgi:hypothetical protein
MNLSLNAEDVRLVQNEAQQVPVIISDLSKPDAQALAATLRNQGREVLSSAEAAAAGILPGA